MNELPFSPLPHSSQVVTAGAAATPITIPRNAGQVRVCVTGATAVYLETDGTAATSTSMQIFPNALEIFSVAPGGVVSFLNTGADSTVAVTFGNGN